MQKVDSNSRLNIAVNIFKPVEQTDIFRLTPKRSSSKSSQSSVVSSPGSGNAPRKNKSCSVSDSENSYPDTKSSSHSDADSDEDSKENEELSILANLPENTLLRRHELYVTDIEDSTDVIFAIAPTIR